MEDKTQLKISKHELDCLKEYQEAYFCILDWWESFNKETQNAINKELNKIFILNDGERV